ncbi:hypothetical protein MKX47_18815 [Solibacillus sp. FSL R7-0668]|uniref:hypothetical protein n=1 Tax=Solibacillus sp. FSL R7-0668 TaxID=2921688 RepID=UPI0030F812F5
MKKTLACLHAHHSNIAYIENALSLYDIELLHFVDPALMQQVTTNSAFTIDDAKHKVKEQLEWIASCHVDAILITCTNYIVILQEHTVSLPILKIDEPYFECICNIQSPQVLLFTNPATVSGTLSRLHQYAHEHQKNIDIEVKVIENTFDLITKGHKSQYDKTIYDYINTMIKEEKVISVALLSMVDASKKVDAEIINPLDPLIKTIVDELDLKEKEQTT